MKKKGCRLHFIKRHPIDISYLGVLYHHWQTYLQYLIHLPAISASLSTSSYQPAFLQVSPVLFVTLPSPNYAKILQIKRRYSINHSDEYYVRLFYPVPSVIISMSLLTKEAGTSPTKVWFPASHTHHRHAYVSARL